MFKAAKRVTLASLTGAAGFGLYQYHTNDDIQRTVTLFKELGPVILHYRIIEQQERFHLIDTQKAEEEYHKLHLKYSTPVMETLRDLRGFYVKVGQVMANRADMLPEIYIEKLRKLEDQVPHLLNGEQAKALVMQSLGLDKLEDLFLEFGDQPIGSASIGQVHKAKLRDGKEVAVKIQGPGSESLFRGDIRGARYFCKVFAPEQVVIFDEIEKQFLTEFDYRAEAKNLDIVSKNMKVFRNVVVPRPYLKYCTKEVLTMEFLKGSKLVDGIRENGREYAKLIGTTLEQLEADMRKEFNEHGLPPVYNGPSALTLELYRKGLAVKDNLLNTPIWLVNQTLGVLHFITRLSLFSHKLGYFKSFIPLNSSFIMNTILEAHGHQLLINGFFNADSHPGNFLMMPDGRIGMIDYGQVKSLTEEQRIIVAKLIVALANNDTGSIIEAYKKSGFRSKYMNQDVMIKLARVTMDQDGRNITEGLNLQQFIDKLYNTDPWEEASDFMIMPVRLSLLMRGVGLMLNHPVSVCTAWKPIAERAIKEYETRNKH
jgi:aarF domain-containing kinase